MATYYNIYIIYIISLYHIICDCRIVCYDMAWYAVLLYYNILFDSRNIILRDIL